MLSPALPPAVLRRVVGIGETHVEGQMDVSRAGGGGGRGGGASSSGGSNSSSSSSSDSSSDSSCPTVTLVGFKKLTHFSEKFLGSSGQVVKIIKYLDLPPPRTGRMRNAPPGIVVENGGRGGSSVEAIGVGGGSTETSRRFEKLRAYANECSWAIRHVYFGGEAVARNLKILESKGITHVVNCVKLELENYFPKKLEYLGLYLQDSGAEDMLCILYDAFDFIENAATQNGKVFVHCSQGVSRSAALVIAYAMWRTGRSFDDVRAEMKERRGVVDPNAAFTLQLMFWDKRRKDQKEDCVIYRIGPQSRHRPTYLVPKLCSSPQSMGGGGARNDALDPRGAFVLKLKKKAILWVGKSCPDQFISAGRRFLCQLFKYEQIGVLQEIVQGGETSEMKIAMGLDSCAPQDQYITEQDEFTQDFSTFHTAITPRTSITEGIHPVGQLGLTPPRPPISTYRKAQSEPR